MPRALFRSGTQRDASRFSGMSGGRVSFFTSLSAAGFAATAISYGPARMGFGLFAFEFRDAFDLSTSQIGLISSLGFLGFFLGLLAAQETLTRFGPKTPILTGLFAATLGLGIAALATGLWVLCLGIFLAMSSAGFAWTPFNDAVHRKVIDPWRPTSLSAISSGTAAGIAGAGLAAFVMVATGFSWRIAWGIFAAASALALVGNWAAMRDMDRDPDSERGRNWRLMLHVAAIPLFVVGFVYGTTSSIFISFAADRMVEQSSLDSVPKRAIPALVYIVLGIFGLAGLATQSLKQAIGLPLLLRLVLGTGAASLAFVALLPQSWAGIVAAAGLQGLHIMMTSAILAFWSDRLFPTVPSLSFTAALLATAAGSILGPALAGLASGAVGPVVMFLGAALLPAATALLIPSAYASEIIPAASGETPP
jgi:predicted MFS family arabinose efflux permease